MKVILKDHVAKVGRKYEVVDVSDGFALNFLIPNRLAELATPSALKSIEVAQSKTEALRGEEMQKLSEVLAKLNGTKITLARPANDAGHLFAKVTEEEILEAIKEQAGEAIPEHALTLSDTIKEVGEHELTLEGGEAKATIVLEVTAT